MNALRRLPVLADMLLADPTDTAQIRIDDVEELAELLETVRDNLAQFHMGSAEGAAAAASILEDAALHSALLRLMAAVVRWPLPAPFSNLASDSGSGTSGDGSGGSTSAGSSGSGGSGTGGSGSGGTGTGGSSGGGTGELNIGEGIQAYADVAWGTCAIVEGLLLLLYEQPRALPAASCFVQKLLRMHTLQCLARRFAAAADSAEALTARQARYTKVLFDLLDSLLFTLQKVPEQGGEALQASLCQELAEALRDSRVMEHAARLLLRLVLGGVSPGGALSATYDTAETSCSYATAYRHIAVQYRNTTVQYKSTREEGQDASTCAALREVLSGRCARHVVLLHGLAVLCMADGGPTYGLPEDVQQAVSARLAQAFPPGLQEPHSVAEAIPVGLLAALDVEPSPPVNARAAVLLLLRLARAAVSSGDAWAVHAQQEGAGVPAHAGVEQLMVPRDKVILVAFGSLEVAWRLLRVRLTAHPPAWAKEAGVECWRLVAAVLGQNMLRTADPASLLPCWVDGQPLHRWVPLLPAGEPLPPTPPPGLAVVLAGGFLPCLERLLRRAGEEPDGPESVVMGALLRDGHTWHVWAHLLEYGEPRQAAALVATLGKLLRRANWAVAPSGNGRKVMRLCAAVLDSPSRFPSRLVDAEGREVGRLLMYAACVWLPALSDHALQAMAAQPAPGTADSEDVWDFLRPLLCWLPLLVLRCAIRSTAGAAAGGRAMVAADPGGCSAADDAGGWRLLLLKGMRVVPLLGAALRHAALQLAQAGVLPLPQAGFCAVLALNCCAVAAVFPHEVLNAATSSAWPPELLRTLLLEAQTGGPGTDGNIAAALATWLEGASAGGNSSSSGSRGAGFGRGGGDTEALWRGCEHYIAMMGLIPGKFGEMSARLVPPAEARGLLRTCSYPGCTSLAGDSEADARMRWCRFCNSCCYCCGECQLSHWREGGHKEACPGGAKARPG
ncbi:hypothetical protein TSOC_006690 [Tetrabaena socialis]|uniref:phytol kinase n=1 Tax=Tetrabaena socialis TaxID=47790 RepID=A0A2J8A325_9CHLO|nr:hypothetical protein TSOC_006690 [Tetrabaena socialis]|eukprot:PNH06898.1 hypothetical protein TSOC_006690 [Tetrabaena socialis]